MRRFVPALALVGLLAGPGQATHAQDAPDPCIAAAVQQAWPYLQQSYAYTPAGVAGAGYGPLTYPFGVGLTPYAQAAFFGPPGVAPSFGPLGPGLTANAIVAGVLRPGGVNLAVPANVSTLISLAAQQQAELNQLNTRYSNAAYYQSAAAAWAGQYATQAAAVFTQAKALCQAPQPAAGESPATAPAETPNP
jgi:hypothetical protein